MIFMFTHSFVFSQVIDFENGMLAYYPFNGTADDMSSRGNDGVVSGATLVADRFGNAKGAYSFDGRTQSIRIPFKELLDFGNQAEFTISLWIKPRDQNTGCILFKNFDYGIKWGGLVKPATIYSGTNNGFLTVQFPNWKYNSWYNLVLIQKKDGLLFYINGAKDFESPVSHQTANSGEDIFIGKHPYYWGGFEGDIDDICIFNRPLNQVEIEALYQIETMPLSVVPRDDFEDIEMQNLVGVWQGVFTQPGNQQIDNYAFWLNIKAKNADEIEGHSRTEISNTKAFGIMQLEGALSQKAVTFNEKRVLREHNPTGLDWCVKFSKLRYSSKDNSLRGNWYADNCRENGQIVLFKSDSPFNFYRNRDGKRVPLAKILAAINENKTRGQDNKIPLNNLSLDIKPIEFLSASSTLTDASKLYLKNNVVSFLNKAIDIKLNVSGHTDNTGDDFVNLALSIARAKAVVTFLIQSGIESSRLEFEGLGESKPVADNSTADGRRLNRRVELTIVDS